ncbi:MAG TPA: DegT/DnrJ/EryC1/StrS family aminotransferase, partial [bacterium]|nr:DegT/DnrJ/EryC1/StrS family aminotransferase [bacterium]
MKLFSISAPYTRSLIPGYPSKEDFISLMKEYFSREALLFSSAKTALYILLRVLHRRSPEKNEVIIPAYTDAGLVSVLRRNGLKIVLADINLKDYGYDIEDLQKRINEKTLAVILVHLFGITQAPETLSSLDLKEKGIYLIEDFAQGFGGYLGNN